MNGAQWADLARNAGVPAAIAFYVLIRLDARLAELAAAVEHMARALLKAHGG